MLRALVWVALGLLPWAPAPAQQTSIIHSPHNLSASGPGAIRATSEQQVCIFCHTPHHATPIQPLWNRYEPTSAYTVYSSSSLDAMPGQPTGTSKLCLSCHDGTIALGSVVSRHQPIAMAGGMTTLQPGASNLGTDLSDDHPISFRYDADLATRDPKLRPPSQLPPTVRLDHRQELQCTSCHDAHSNAFGKFLVMDNSNSQLCTTCHIPGDTNIAAHAQCSSCHQPHSAPSGAHLLRGQTVSMTCVSCHGGGASPQGTNIAADLNKVSRHDTGTHLATGGEMLGNAMFCNDCHESHTMQSATAVAPQISPKLGRVSGVSASGAPLPVATNEYEVCFKCHGDNAVSQPTVSRQIAQNNTRLEFDPSAVSFHPVQAAGRSSDVPSLRPGLTTASVIYCTSCHASDAMGVAESRGPHGSNNRPLLKLPYETMDHTAESDAAYALCYSCHDRTSILSNQSFSGHNLHVVGQSTPCATCHDAHGISSAQGTMLNNSHLINFNIAVVQPDPITQRLEYRSTGPRTGECYLSCHGVPHSPKTYPTPAATIPPAP